MLSMSDTSSGGMETAQDFIGIKLDFNGSKDFGIRSRADSTDDNDSHDNSTAFTFLINTDYYFEFQRLDATHARGTLYTDSDYSEVIAHTGVGIVPANVTSLRYFRLSHIIISDASKSEELAREVIKIGLN